MFSMQSLEVTISITDMLSLSALITTSVLFLEVTVFCWLKSEVSYNALLVMGHFQIREL